MHSDYKPLNARPYRGISGARAEVWASKREHAPGRRCWYYRVLDSTGRVVFTDDTCDFGKIVEAAARRVAATREVEEAGHVFEYSYAELVAKARTDL